MVSVCWETSAPFFHTFCVATFSAVAVMEKDSLAVEGTTIYGCPTWESLETVFGQLFFGFWSKDVIDVHTGHVGACGDTPLINSASAAPE